MVGEIISIKIRFGNGTRKTLDYGHVEFAKEERKRQVLHTMPWVDVREWQRCEERNPDALNWMPCPVTGVEAMHERVAKQANNARLQLSLLGDSPKSDWLASPMWVIPTVAFIDTWQWTPYVALIVLGGLQSLPPNVYEAAQIDGASRWTLFRHITLPLLSPTLVFLIVVSTIQAFRVFDPVYVMSGGLGGPANSTATLVFYLYKQAFSNLDGGYASALAYLIVGIALALTVVQLNLSKRWVTYQ